jgi:riboflavin biosynthesis pyrimidine reductase
MFDGPALETMDERVELQLVDLRRVGDDCRLTYRKAC